MVVATGFFDGVHLGHRQVLGRLVEEAARRGERSAVVTFWPHPRAVLQDSARDLRLLSSLEEKKRMLLDCGVDHVELIPFTPAFSSLTAKEYLQQIVIGRLGASAILLGYDNRIGSDCRSVDDAVRAAREAGLEVIVCDPLGTISSTSIRRSLEGGDVSGAAAMLGYDYSLSGVVVAGNRLGRTIGFPTANIRLYDPLKLVPANGVYLVRVSLQDQTHYGMCNIGVKPTIGGSNGRTIETNIFDFDREIYGLDLTLTFLKRIRDERRFPSLGDLAAQLGQDKQTALSFVHLFA